MDVSHMREVLTLAEHLNFTTAAAELYVSQPTLTRHLGAIEDAYFDQEGLIKSAHPKTLLVDLSASTPSLAREISAVATVSNLRFVEAPLALHDIACADAFTFDNLICFVAGEDDDVAEAAELLSHVASDVRLCGTVGRGALAKVAHTIQVTAQAISPPRST